MCPDALTKLVDRKAMLPSVTEVRGAKSPLRLAVMLSWKPGLAGYVKARRIRLG